MGDGQEGLAGAGRPQREHQLVVREQVEVARLGGGLGGHRAAPADRAAAVPAPSLVDGDADVGLDDLQSLVGAVGDDLQRLLGSSARLGLAVQSDAAAGGLQEHVEGVLEEGGMAAVLAPGGADARLAQRQELGGAAAQAAAGTRSPARLFGPVETIRTGAMFPIKRSSPSQCTAWR